MTRQVLIDLLLFLTPFAVYALYWRFYGKHRQDAHEKKTPWTMLVSVGLGLVALSFIVWGLLPKEPTDGVYVPPRMENGKIVPGYVAPADKPPANGP